MAKQRKAREHEDGSNETSDAEKLAAVEDERQRMAELQERPDEQPQRPDLEQGERMKAVQGLREGDPEKEAERTTLAEDGTADLPESVKTAQGVSLERQDRAAAGGGAAQRSRREADDTSGPERVLDEETIDRLRLTGEAEASEVARIGRNRESEPTFLVRDVDLPGGIRMDQKQPTEDGPSAGQPGGAPLGEPSGGRKHDPDAPWPAPLTHQADAPTPSPEPGPEPDVQLNPPQDRPFVHSGGSAVGVPGPGARPVERTLAPPGTRRGNIPVEPGESSPVERTHAGDPARDSAGAVKIDHLADTVIQAALAEFPADQQPDHLRVKRALELAGRKVTVEWRRLMEQRAAAA